MENKKLSLSNIIIIFFLSLFVILGTLIAVCGGIFIVISPNILALIYIGIGCSFIFLGYNGIKKIKNQ